MKYELLYQPSFAVARILLEMGESIRAESGAMVSMSTSVKLESKASGGIGKMFGRMLGGESAFLTTFTAEQGAGEVLLAPSTPGDIMPLTVTGPVMVTSGSYLAGDVSLETETVASMKSFFGGEGLFMMRISGQGLLLLSAFGAIHAIQLQAGQSYIVDTGHLVAFSDGMGYALKKAAKGLLGSLTSGEGIVAELTGPGTIYIQTRTPSGFASWLSRLMPKSG
jgi:uncharacterized protein (TIGR00266 family)